MLGSDIYRLILYAWPAFLVALPMIWPKGLQNQAGLVIANLLCGWTHFGIMTFENLPGNERFLQRLVGLTIILVCWIFAIRRIRYQVR
jgi:hypothetical protein